MVYCSLIFIMSIPVLFINSNLLNIDEDIAFLTDFFKNKNVRITSNLCWKNHKLKMFIEENTKFRQIRVFKTISVEKLNAIFSHMSINTNNWFMMDYRNNCMNDEILRTINNKKLFRYPLKYLVLIDKMNYFKLLELVQSFHLLPMSEMVISCFEKGSVKMYQPYKIGENENLIIENYGNWSAENRSIAFYSIPSITRRRDFNGYTLVVSAVVKNISSTLVKHFDDISETKEEEPYFFQEIPNMYNLMQYLNATFRFKTFESYGYLNHSTGVFSGLAGDLHNEGSHISGTTLMLSEERQRIVEFIKTYSYWSTKAKFILKKPSMSYVENIYRTTFANEVYITILVILVVFGVVLYFILNWEVGYMHQQQKQHKITISDIILISLEAICQQGTFVDSKTVSGRIIILLLFVSFMFFSVAYSAYLLVLFQSTKPISSVRELVDSQIKCGGFNVSFMAAYYESTEDGALRDLYRKKIYPDNFFSLEDGLNKVQEGNFAFQVTLGPAYNHIIKTYSNYDICRLQELPGYMNAEMYIAVPKTSQYKKFFKIGLLLAEERGLQSRIKNRMSLRPKCYNEGRANFQSVRLYDCRSVFLMYTLGVIVSLIVLLIEMSIAKYSRK